MPDASICMEVNYLIQHQKATKGFCIFAVRSIKIKMTGYKDGKTQKSKTKIFSEKR